MRFFEHLERTARERGSLLCVGLDPRPDRFPPEVQAEPDPIFVYNQRIIDATRDLVCAFKPNFAFYEACGPKGLEALRRTIAYIGPDTPVILDAKRGDIGSTAEAYAQAAFEVWGAGAVTVHPYLGGDSIAPFLDHPGRAVFVLCHTSNPGAGEFQSLTCDGEPLYLRVARLSQQWPGSPSIGLVVGATFPHELEETRRIAPGAWFLVPGIGTQGGDLDAAVAAGLRSDGLGMVINVSRAVYHAEDPRAAAAELVSQIHVARQRASARPALPRASAEEGLILDLARVGAVRFGEFTLKSGRVSPIYIDLRLLASYPDVLARVASAYVALIRERAIQADRIAAIPYAALPIGTAVSLQTGMPLIYPRKETKTYGTRQAVEGVYRAGETTVVLDDLITTGDSKIEAVAPLQEAGLRIRDIVVLIDRQSGGAEMLAEHGYQLHSVFTLRRILDVLVDAGRIEARQREAVHHWLQAEDGRR